MAVQVEPEALKFALDGLNQDHGILGQAGLIQQRHGDDIVIALSTRFSLSEESDSCANNFMRKLDLHRHFPGHHFYMYAPNAFPKSTCDPEWTNMEWPCLGTFDTCQIQDPDFKTGKPTNNSCWRYSYRYHLEEAKRTNGFMLQVVDYDKEAQRHVLGDGQAIEVVMAQQVGTKIFRICQPVPLKSSMIGNHAERGYDFFEGYPLWALIRCVRDWYSERCANTVGCEIQVYNDGKWKTYIRQLAPVDVTVPSPHSAPWNVASKWTVYDKNVYSRKEKAYKKALPLRASSSSSSESSSSGGW